MCKELAEEEAAEALLIKEETKEVEDLPEALPTIPEGVEEEEESDTCALPIPGILPRRAVRNFLVRKACDKI